LHEKESKTPAMDNGNQHRRSRVTWATQTLEPRMIMENPCERNNEPHNDEKTSTAEIDRESPMDSSSTEQNG